MFRLILLFIIFVSSPSHADQGLNITCLNMKSILGRKYEPLQFKLETMGFHYFDKKIHLRRGPSNLHQETALRRS